MVAEQRYILGFIGIRIDLTEVQEDERQQDLWDMYI